MCSIIFFSTPPGIKHFSIYNSNRNQHKVEREYENVKSFLLNKRERECGHKNVQNYMGSTSEVK